MENLGRGVERPIAYTVAALTPQALLLKFKLGRIPGYSHPYGFAEGEGGTAWAQIDLSSVVWTTIDDAELGAFQSTPDLQAAPIRDDLEAFSALYGTGRPLDVVHAEPIALYVDHAKPSVSQLQASAKNVLRVASVNRKSVVLPYNGFGCIALLVTDADGSTRITLIDPPWREYHESWHRPVQVLLYPVRLAQAGLYLVACMFGGCH